MSFYLNNNSPCKPGPIRNAGCGSVCEKVCIETTKVFDACLTQEKETGVSLTATDFSPAGPTNPLTFISANCYDGATVSNIIIDRLTTNPNFANVTVTITVPVVISYVDAASVSGTAQSTLTFTRNAVLFVPQPALTPVNVTAVVSCVSTKGSYSGNNVFVVDFCVTSIIKIVAVVDLLIPSYGYIPIPECTQTNPVCPGAPTIPIFPTAE